MIKTIKLDIEKVFDVVRHRLDPETKGTPYKGFSKPLSVEQQDAFLNKSIQMFIHGVAETTDKAIRLQAFSGSSDLPQLTADVFDVTLAAPNFDLSWQNVFKGMKLQKGQLFWEISDVSNGIEFKEIPEGGKVEIASLSGNKAKVDVKKYGAGLGITWEMIEGRKLYAFAEALETVRAKLYKVWADTHYALLSAAAQNHQISWQGTSSETTLERDIMTLNAGAYQIANACKDKGYGDTANAPLILFISPLYKTRIEAARNNQSSAFLSSGGQRLQWPIEVYYTFNSQITANKGILVLPGNKIQNAVYLRELGLSRQEIESLSEIRTYWTAFGAAVGDDAQCAELSLS